MTNAFGSLPLQDTLLLRMWPEMEDVRVQNLG